MQMAAGEEEDCVSVDYVSVLVGEEGTVGVAVEGDAEGSFLVDDFTGYDLGMECSAVLVDVAAVWAGVSDVDFAAEIAEELGGYCGGCSVGAVDYDAVVVEGEVGDGGQEEFYVVGSVGFVNGRC